MLKNVNAYTKFDLLGSRFQWQYSLKFKGYVKKTKFHNRPHQFNKVLSRAEWQITINYELDLLNRNCPIPGAHIK